MALSDAAKAGTYLFVGVVQFGIFLIVAETLYPGYSVANNYISDLGPPCQGGLACASGNSWLLFDLSIVVLGILLLVSAYYLQRYFQWGPPAGLMVVAGVGCIGVGVFNESAPYSLHGIFSLVTFVGIGLTAVVAFWLQKPPLSYFSVILGLISLVSLILYVSDTGTYYGSFFGIGVGGLERMIVYPVLLWGVAFGGHLMALDEPK